jgi:hypothetical protein
VTIRAWLPAVVFVAILPLALRGDDKELLQSVKDRMKIEAQRVEREFADERAAAYKLVRSDDPKLAEATTKLQDLLAMVEKDKSLDAKRRQVLIVTLKWDLDKVKEIAAERRKPSRTESTSPPPSVINRERDTPRKTDDDRRGSTRDAKSVIESRKGNLRDSYTEREKKREAYNRVARDVDRSAVPESDVYKLPRDWAERTRKRGSAIKMTAKERAIMDSLNKTIEVDFAEATFSEVIDYLKKKTGIDIALDKKGLDDASVTYDTKVNLKLKASTRTIFRKLLSDLGLAYFIKDEAMQITSQERARQETTVRTYYIGDLAMITDVRLPLIIKQIEMIKTVNTIIEQIKSMEPKSWKDNDPEAPGTIVFDPARVTLIIRQTAEFHFSMSGK